MNRVDMDVLCIGHACYDIIFSVSHQPAANEKMLADASYHFGGGPAANAAVTVSRLGGKSVFCGYIGSDMYGDRHFNELVQEKVLTDFIIRGKTTTPYSTVLVKPDGNRTVVNYRSTMYHLQANAIDFKPLRFKALLIDGHEPFLAKPIIKRARKDKLPVILDAGSVHDGTVDLMYETDYLIASEDFALQFTGQKDCFRALQKIYKSGTDIVITLGSRGLIWKSGAGEGSLPAFKVPVIDTTGCGDTFHGAFAYGLAQKMSWTDLLSYSSAAAALCATRFGARPGIPTGHEVSSLLKKTLTSL